MSEGYTKQQIEAYFNLAGEPSLTKTHGRKPVDRMNKAINYLYYLSELIDPEQLYYEFHCKFLNQGICSPIGFEDSDYESFGIVDEAGNLTNAGALLADESPVRHSRVFCTRWNGLDKAPGVIDAIDDKEFSGGLINLLQDGTEFVTNNSKKAWKKVSDGRIEMPDYPERAVLEGLVNALIHRNYLEVGSEVHIDLFDDRLEIYSPGGMFDGSKVQDRDLMNIPSRRRNPIIADIFNRLKYMDRRGSGFKKIL